MDRYLSSYGQMHHTACARYVSRLDTGRNCKNQKDMKLRSKPRYKFSLTDPHYESDPFAYFALF